MSKFLSLPDWAGLPPKGVRLEVIKGGIVKYRRRLISKSCYLFGRNRDAVDIRLNNVSCSRIHAALLYHPQLQKFVLVDMKSSHGTFITDDKGNKAMLKPCHPSVIPFGTIFGFGFSTRSYVIREDHKTTPIRTVSSAELLSFEDQLKEVLALEFLGINASEGEDSSRTQANPKKRKWENPNPNSKSVSFDMAHEVINFEESDPQQDLGKIRESDAKRSRTEQNYSPETEGKVVVRLNEIGTLSPKPFPFVERQLQEGSPLFDFDEPAFFTCQPPPCQLQPHQSPGNRSVLTSEGSTSDAGSPFLSSTSSPLKTTYDTDTTPPFFLHDWSSDLTSEQEVEPQKKQYPKEIWPRELLPALSNDD